MEVRSLLQNGRYAQVLTHSDSRPVLESFVNSTLTNDTATTTEGEQALHVGLAALSAFLQVNVTGPALESAARVQQLFAELETSAGASAPARKTYLASLDVDGVSVYPHTPQIELFCLARWVFSSWRSSSLPPRTPAIPDSTEADDADPAESSLPWLRLRIHSWHYKLLTEPNPGPGSVFNKMTQWSDLPTLQEQIQQCLDATEQQLSDTATWTRTARVQFLVEQTNVYAMLGLDTKAKAALDAAAKLARFEYVLSGALGKRTKFQDKSTSQLVILAKSAHDSTRDVDKAVPQALALNNDTLLERIDFTDARGAQDESVPAALRGLTPNNQPPLSPLDQIILLSEATLKDAFAPADSLTLEEILPFATRVLSDKSTNWQVYSQALIVRSRIELHRSRTVERGVLQMQAMVDQVVVDTTAPEPAASASAETAKTETTHDKAVPVIAIMGPADTPSTNEPETPADKPSTFFPAAEAGEQAPPQVRLRYVHALSTPPRWHLEAELAFAWAGVGSLISALEIFKRLRLWAEVALCLASSGAADDEGGRGSGGEDKARGLVRWQIFQATDPSLEPKGGADGTTLDALSLKPADFQGAERDPPPANAPRLFCILGDIEAEPKHYERAWELSKGRYSRAQRSLGEHYLQKQAWDKALDAYKKAVAANRLNPQLWGRVGDIHLRLGQFSEAAEAFSRALGAANDASGGEDARTWSNLGSALYSLYLEVVKKDKEEETRRKADGDDVSPPAPQAERADDEEDDNDGFQPQRTAETGKRNPGTLLAQSLAAYKRGATISHDNWRIWDNVVTLASRVRPPAVSDIILAMRNILLVRNTEEAIDVNVVRLLLNETVLAQPKPAGGVPARGTPEKAVCDLIETTLVPLITKRSELWDVVARARVWRSDYGGAVEAAEKGWRAAMGGAGSGSTLSVGSSSSSRVDDEKRNWLENADAWDDVVARTDELVSILENYGAEAPAVGARWKAKARSALRSVMGKGKERWEGSAGWATLASLLEGLT